MAEGVEQYLPQGSPQPQEPVSHTVADYLPQNLAPVAKFQAKAQEEQAAKQALAEQKGQAQAQQLDNQLAPNAFAGVHSVKDVHTGLDLAEDPDGSIWLTSVGGAPQKFHPTEAGKLLNDKLSGYYPTTVDQANEHVNKQNWDNASFAAKVDYVGRKLDTTIADAITAPVQLGARLLGADQKTSEALSGENLIRKLDSLIYGKEAAAHESDEARKLEKGAPGLLNTAIDVGGFVLGGAAVGGAARLAGAGAEALGLSSKGAAALEQGAANLSTAGLGKAAASVSEKLAVSLGVDAGRAAKLASYADTVAQGAAMGATVAPHEAWLNNEPLTAEAQWNSIGLGALLGLGTHAGVEAVGAAGRAAVKAPSALMEKVFGKVASSDEKAMQEFAENMSGTSQPKGFGKKLADVGQWIKDTAEKKIAEKTGASLEDVQELGPLSPKHEWAKKIYENRDEAISSGAKDITDALTELHAEGKDISKVVQDVELKKEHIGRLLEGSDHDAIMQLGKAKAAELSDALDQIENVSGAKVHKVNTAINDLGGLNNAEIFDEGMRPMTLHNAAYEGATPEEATKIAAGRADVKNAAAMPNSKRFEPIKVEAIQHEDGTVTATIIDGRHRFRAAQEAGASEIGANVKLYKQVGEGYQELGEKTGAFPFKASSDARSMLGQGKAVQAIRYTYEDAIQRLTKAESPADVVSALDQFKRGAQKAKVLAEKSRPSLDFEIEQARNRARLMFEVSENTRTLLEDEGLFGKFGEAQRETNSRINRVLDTDRYVRQNFFENTGQVSRGEDFGAARFEINPARVESYLNGLGTNRSQRLDSFLRDNIDARRQLAETLGKYYEADNAKVLNATKAADRAISALKSLDETVRVSNVMDHILSKGAHASGQNMHGAAVAAMAGHMFGGGIGSVAALGLKAVAHAVSDPVKFATQAIALRNAAAKFSSGIEKNVERALMSMPEATKAARTVRTVATREETEARYSKVATAVNKLAADPEHLTNQVSNISGHVEHPAAQQALTSTAMNAAGFLASKLPKPLYADAVSKEPQIQNVSASQKDTFLRYVDAVNKPSAFFEDLTRGIATPEQAETARTLLPQAFGIAQQKAITTFASGKVTASYQVRLNIQSMLGVNIEPIVSPDLRKFLQASMAQNAQSKPQTQGPKAMGAPSAAKNLSSPLSNLKL